MHGILCIETTHIYAEMVKNYKHFKISKCCFMILKSMKQEINIG